MFLPPTRSCPPSPTTGSGRRRGPSSARNPSYSSQSKSNDLSTEIFSMTQRAHYFYLSIILSPSSYLSLSLPVSPPHPPSLLESLSKLKIVYPHYRKEKKSNEARVYIIGWRKKPQLILALIIWIFLNNCLHLPHQPRLPWMRFLRARGTEERQ